jgi:hypothetical protein
LTFRGFAAGDAGERGLCRPESAGVAKNAAPVSGFVKLFPGGIPGADRDWVDLRGGSAGLRVVALKVSDVDSERLLLRIEQGWLAQDRRGGGPVCCQTPLIPAHEPFPAMPRLRDDGARRWFAAAGKAALRLFDSVLVTVSTICRFSFVCAQARIETE